MPFLSAYCNTRCNTNSARSFPSYLTSEANASSHSRVSIGSLSFHSFVILPFLSHVLRPSLLEYKENSKDLRLLLSPILDCNPCPHAQRANFDHYFMDQKP